MMFFDVLRWLMMVSWWSIDDWWLNDGLLFWNDGEMMVNDDNDG